MTWSTPKRNRNKWLQNWVDDMHNLLIASEKKIKKDYLEPSNFVIFITLILGKFVGCLFALAWMKKLHRLRLLFEEFQFFSLSQKKMMKISLLNLAIDQINNIARHNLIDTKYRQMVFQSLGGVVVATSLGTPGQTKVSGDHHRETTHEVCLSAAE